MPPGARPLFTEYGGDPSRLWNLVHPGGFEKEREPTVEFRRWERHLVDGIAVDLGFTPQWHAPFISAEGLETYGAGFFENYLANPQSKLVCLSKT